MEKCVFIGYPARYKEWKFYNPTTKKVVISERAEFDERYYPGLKRSGSNPTPSPPIPSFSLIPPASIPHLPTFIDYMPAPEEDQVIPATHPGGGGPVASQPELAADFPDPPKPLQGLIPTMYPISHLVTTQDTSSQ